MRLPAETRKAKEGMYSSKVEKRKKMDKQSATKIIKNTFENSFNREQYTYFIKNLFKSLDYESENAVFQLHGQYIPDAFRPYTKKYERIGKYEDTDANKVDALVVYLKKQPSLERARTMQRNFIAWYLNGSRGDVQKEASVVAFVSPDFEDWRFSLVKMEYHLAKSETGKTKVKEELTPAKRYSFLVGKNESSHTAKSQLLPILQKDKNPLLSDFEEAFSVEKVTKEFFVKYRELFWATKDALDKILNKDDAVRKDFESKSIDTTNFAKKLLGQVVFLYFLQKKGWFGVERDANWGTGPKNFLRLLFEKNIVGYDNFFNEILEPLFYEALASERSDNFYSRFDCKIPFLNGGLFDPLGDYDWIHTDILLSNKLFSNSKKTKEGDTGTGILDVFDRYNFTVKEDEPLEKEVAVDPEMLGKVFENLLEVKDRKSKGTYYTPREIVHYMCQESLINYLVTGLNNTSDGDPKGLLRGGGKITRDGIETLVRLGETAVEHDSRVEHYGKETKTYPYKLPKTIRKNAKLLDKKLANIRVCDPAAGSGAFLVGMMSEIIKARKILTTYFDNKRGRMAYNFKYHAIQNCLYGVDIDPGAVEIAKLRLWLSLVVDEEDIKRIRPLPNLDYKIVCGNSLLGVERGLENWQLFSQFEQLKPLYFDETNIHKKKKYKKQIDELINEITKGHENFDFEVYFSEVFHDKKGFDVVIANPPYLEARSAEFTGQMKDEAQQGTKMRWGNDSKYITRGADLLIYFFELGIYLLSKRGTLVFITQNSWLNTDYGKKIQNFLLKNTNVKAIVDSDFKYFDSKLGPNINTVILIFFGKKADKKNVTTFVRYHENFDRIEYSVLCNDVICLSSQAEVKKFKYSNPMLKSLKWGTLLSSSSDILQMFSLLEKKGKRLNQLSNYNLSIGQGLNLRKTFVVDRKTLKDFPFIAERLIPFMGTGDGAPFVLEKTKQFIVDGSQLELSQIKKLKSVGIHVFQPSSTSKLKPLLILPRGINRHFCAMNSVQAYSSSGVDIYDNKGNFPKELALNLWLFLNSSIAWLIREITGRKSLGGGLLKAEATDLREAPIYFDFNRARDIQKIYKKLKKRQALPTVDEVDTDEHKIIDDIIFDYLELSQEQRNKIVELLKKHILGRLTKSKT